MIQADGLVKSYGPVRAVERVSFSVQRGEIVGFVGRNGAGKSTTMRMLTGYLFPDQGSVEIAGLPMDGASLEARARIGYLPEHTPLYREMRVDGYLGFVARLRGLGGNRRRAALEQVVHLTDLGDHATRRIRTLSKGYRQRVGLAQALIGDPDVLILDEPTSGLDPAETVRIRERIVALAQHTTVLLSTHVLSEVEEICQRAIIIDAGRIVADGTLEELAEEQGETLAVSFGGDPPEALGALGELEGVSRIQVARLSGAGRRRFLMSVADRDEVAERVARLAHERGWWLAELSHELPSLERVFLSRTHELATELGPDSPGGPRTRERRP